MENFAGAHFQKFDSQEKAETFLKDSLLVDTKKNLYVVARGKIPGIYWEWLESSYYHNLLCYIMSRLAEVHPFLLRSHAQKQLVGTPRNKYKKIDNLEDAELFYDDHRDKWFSCVENTKIK